MPLDNISELKRRVPGGKYALARAIAERARQLQSGATPLTEVKTPNPLSVAIEEILQGKVTFRFEEQAQSGAASAESGEAQASGEGSATPPSVPE
ncbi:MAG: DNA-directed RNA polymerase subunit omega [Armatimonadota bacterium]|nr:DNA-directed RNA polymerase subunit omega [Armatimonadota bacterium]